MTTIKEQDSQEIHAILSGLACQVHKRYTGGHRPKTACFACWAIYVVGLIDKSYSIHRLED